MTFCGWNGAKYVGGGQCKFFPRKNRAKNFLYTSSPLCYNYQLFHSYYYVWLLWFKCLWTSNSKISLVETLFNSSSNGMSYNLKKKYFSDRF